jgi:hypothetical protein
MEAPSLLSCGFVPEDDVLVMIVHIMHLCKAAALVGGYSDILFILETPF